MFYTEFFLQDSLVLYYIVPILHIKHENSIDFVSKIPKPVNLIVMEHDCMLVP